MRILTKYMRIRYQNMKKYIGTGRLCALVLAFVLVIINWFDCQGQILDRSGRDSDKPGLDLDMQGLWKTNRDIA